MDVLRRCARCFVWLSWLGVAPLTPISAVAQNQITIDATTLVSAPVPVQAALGTSTNPHGQTIGANSEYLTLNGKPWLPVMGEFHFSRYPAQEWEQEILKMKSAGVNIVSTYIIWIHHEQIKGQFDWTSQRDLRRFVELCGRHGMYVFVRVGPWAHGEVRNGGLPDWVMKASPVRQNDPVYLAEVKPYFDQIGAELKGQLWKDGGPVIGVQIENEYNLRGPGKGPEHIHELKSMAIEAGLDVPLYTVTGWDGAAIPLDAVLPVFGGYPDAPWGGTAGPMPPNEVYAFRFHNRVAGNMGAIGGPGQNGANVYQQTPFLTAEVGDGIEDTYFRRPVVSPDDVAAIAPIMLGSGVNLLGYYMFHGGRNPDSKDATTLQESQRTAYPTDVPVRSYDFQAPLGEFGQERASLRKLKLVHYFLNDFGTELAPMSPREPEKQPQSAADMSVPRVAARTSGGSGYLFFSNHVRGLAMPRRNGFQIALRLPGGTVKCPEQPIDLPADVYGIWPVNLHIGTNNLVYSTAQLFKRVQVGGETNYLFFSIPGVRPEFAFAAGTAVSQLSSGVQSLETGHGLILRASIDAENTFQLGDGTRIVVLPQTVAEQVWRGDDATVLLMTPADAFSDGKHWTVQSSGEHKVAVGVFGSGDPKALNATLTPSQNSGVFRSFLAEVPEVSLPVKVERIGPAQPRAPWAYGPKLAWRPQPVPLAPEDPEFQAADRWRIQLPPLRWSSTLSDAFLDVSYEGDAARLYSGEKLMDDNFWNGLSWTVGLRELADSSGQLSSTLQLRILPLPLHYPMYIESASKLQFPEGKADDIEGIKLIPQYQFQLDLR